MEVSKIVESNRNFVAALLITTGVVARLIPHEPNFAPVAALILLAGVLLGKKYALIVALGTMVLSDLALGLYSSVAFTWFAIASIAVLGSYLRRYRVFARIVIGGIGASVLFFAISNFGVWLSSGMYAHTISGLIDCYVMAVPFFRATVLSDIIYTASFFGLLAAVEHGIALYRRRDLVV